MPSCAVTSAGKAAGSSAKQPGSIDRAIQAKRINRFVDLIDLDAWTQQFEFGMELSEPIFHEKKHKVETRDKSLRIIWSARLFDRI